MSIKADLVEFKMSTESFKAQVWSLTLSAVLGDQHWRSPSNWEGSLVSTADFRFFWPQIWPLYRGTSEGVLRKERQRRTCMGVEQPRTVRTPDRVRTGSGPCGHRMVCMLRQPVRGLGRDAFKTPRKKIAGRSLIRFFLPIKQYNMFKKCRKCISIQHMEVS